MKSSIQISRRRVLQASICLSASAPWAFTSLARAERNQAPSLVRPANVGSLDTRAKIVIELDGKLLLKPNKPDRDAKPREAEVRAKSTLDYFEKLAFENSQFVASARRYVEAQSENWIEGTRGEQTLRPECKQTRLLRHDGTWQQFCEEQPLDLRETQLLQSPVNSGSMELLLPAKPAKVGTVWTFENDELSEIFNLEAVHKNSIKARLTKIEQTIATIEIDGEIEATANSVPTKLKIKGNYRAEIGSTAAIITWIGISVREDREISEAEPGFAVTALVRMIRMKTDSKLSTTADALRSLPTKEDAGRWLVRIESASGGFSMLGDRRWRTFADSREETILRFVKNNTIVAQCNISRLTSLEPGKQVTLEGMQEDIKRSLGEKFVEFLEANERVTSSQLRLMRSVASGMVQEVPVQWIYNHLSNDNGDRIALIATLGSNMVEDFAGNDVQLASSFRLLDLASEANDATEPVERSASSESGVNK